MTALPLSLTSYPQCDRCGAFFGAHMPLCPWWDEDHEDEVCVIPPEAEEWA